MKLRCILGTLVALARPCPAPFGFTSRLICSIAVKSLLLSGAKLEYTPVRTHKQVSIVLFTIDTSFDTLS